MKSIITILFAISVGSLFAQRELQAIGEWEYHVPLNRGVAIANAGDIIYSASKFGLFSYNKSTEEISHYSKVNGLSDVEISYIAYYQPLDILMIAYVNSNIDILQNNTITNFNDILRKQIVGEKTISHIHFNDDLAYISTTFGVVVFDLVKLEVKETYSSLGSSGEKLAIFQSTTLNDSIYLAAENGILAAKLSNTINLLDFNNWSNIKPHEGGYSNIASISNVIWTLQSDTAVVEKYELGIWDTVHTYSGTKSINISSDQLALINNDNFTIINSSGEIETIEIPTSHLPVQFMVDEDNDYWISDLTRGLLKYESGSFTSYTPKGPSTGKVFSIQYSNNSIYVTQGGYDSRTVKSFKSFSVDQLTSKNWSTIGYWRDTVLRNVTDVTQTLSFNGITYYATHSEGVVKKENGEFTVYNDKNSPLRSLDTLSGLVRAPSIAVDDENNLWVVNHSVPQGDTSIFKLGLDGKWTGYIFPTIPSSRVPLKIFVDKNNVKWVILSSTSSGNGVLVFDDEEDDFRHVIKGFERGDLQDDKITDIAFDKSGAVWMVGRAGVSVFQNPSTIFEGGENNDATHPTFEGRPLMETEYCTSIAIDGGNRKWIGTENGLFLMSENGTTQLELFNKENSPLPTNKINDLAIHPTTGELFIGTDLGLITYRTNSTQGAGSCKGQIKVFPNPIEPDYNGEVGISVLTDDAEIKITDTWGNLVYDIEANGGTASWNMKDYNNNEVASGVYMVLVNGRGRKRSCTERLAIIR